jgi:hypothetical protein
MSTLKVSNLQNAGASAVQVNLTPTEVSFTGAANALTPAVDTNNTSIATTAFVIGQASSASPLMDGTATIGTSVRFARQDHVHPTDTSRAPLASPALTGTPTAPTAAADTDTTQIATTQYVIGQGYLKSSSAASTYAPLASPTFTGTVSASTINITMADTSSAASHYVVEVGSDGILRPKTLANVQSEVVTNATVNSASATVLGTVTTGTWNATSIALNRGGTNASLTAVAGGAVYSTGSAMAITAAGVTDQILVSNGANAPTWQDLPVLNTFFLAGM